jgi:hypothetical protein
MSKCPGQAGTFAKMRTAMRHHVMQERGVIEEQRLDETEVGEGTTVTFIDAKQPNASYLQASVAGLNPNSGRFDINHHLDGDGGRRSVCEVGQAARRSAAKACSRGARLWHVRSS